MPDSGLVLTLSQNGNNDDSCAAAAINTSLSVLNEWCEAMCLFNEIRSAIHAVSQKSLTNPLCRLERPHRQDDDRRKDFVPFRLSFAIAARRACMHCEDSVRTTSETTKKGPIAWAAREHNWLLTACLFRMIEKTSSWEAETNG
jgi:hypothetical protein